MADDYVCTLDAASVKKAADELNELPSDRLAAVQSLRQWVQQQPHIKCPTDAYFLLAFLRARKFSQLESRILLEKHLALRAKYCDRFLNLDPRKQVFKEMRKMGFMVVLPKRDKDGRMVMIMRPGRTDPSFKIYSKLDEFRFMSVMMDAIYLLDEMNQVHGAVVIVDFGGYSLKHQKAYTIEENRQVMQIWTGGYPARIKAMHFYNIGGMMEFLAVMIKMVLSDTIKDRLHVHGQVLEGLYKHVPMEILPDDYLPDDYTGPRGAGTWEELYKHTDEYMSGDLVTERMRFLSSDKFGLDEKKRPQADKGQPVASFRKLNID